MTRTPAIGLLALCVASPAAGVDIQVSPGGSIAVAVAGASAGDRVLVQAGVYAEHVALKDGVALRGGYDGSFSEGSRNPLTNVTTIDGSGTDPAITSGALVGAATSVDGFVLTGGGGSPGAGAIITGGAPVFSNNEISGNLSTGLAGGIYVRGGSSARFVGNVFRNNSSDGSGGGLRIESSPVSVVGNTFEDNTAPHSGAGIYAFNSALACSANTFRSNLAGEGGGGGIYVQLSLGVSIVGNTFEDNQAPFGGGVFARDDSEVLLDGNTFTNCQATLSGGGVAAFNYTTLTLVHNRFDTCSADVGGGGLFAHLSVVNITGEQDLLPATSSLFVDCAASGPPDPAARGVGGAISVNRSSGQIRGVLFLNCSADSVGGGIYGLHSEMQIDRNVFESCVAPDGGALTLHTSNPTFHKTSLVRSNTFWGNRATASTGEPGGGALFISAQPNVVRFAGNIVANTLAGSCLRCRGGGSIAMSCTSIQIGAGNPAVPIPGPASDRCVQAFNTSIRNRVEDPKFCGAPADYRLQSCSPAVDAGCSQTGTPPKENRGAIADNTECACSLVAVEAESWGKIKARYR